MGNAFGIAQIGGCIVDDDIIGVDRFNDWAIAQWAEISLLEPSTAEPNHQQHAIGIGVVFLGGRCQIMIDVTFQRIGVLILLQICVVVVIADLRRTIHRQQLRPSIGLEPQACLKQQRMPNLAHALDRSTIRSTRQSRNFDFQAEQLDPLGTILDPLFAGVEVIPDATHQIFGDTRLFTIADLIDQIAEPVGVVDTL